ncbi:LuxR C-terminal-related transcriptional regulator [Umezawaea endophytica]|uniref:helix-turn-helix transcriptional regulator n=1 Tax=Umezawaea endophytica TaxID=1654476 RepID=UPI0035E86F60
MTALVLAPAVADALDRASRARHVVVAGPSGVGKTALLSTLDKRVVDNAESLSEAAVAALVADVAAGADLAVAHRPTRNPRLPVLLAALAPSVVRVRLGPWGRDQVGDFLRERTGRQPAARAPHALHQRTGGVPAFLEAALSKDPVGALAPALDELGADVRTLLLAVALGAPLDLDLLAEALRTTPDAAQAVVDAARAASVIGADGGVPPIVAHAVRVLTPVDERVELARTLLRSQQDRKQSIRALATSLLDLPGAVADQAGALVAAAQETLRDDPVLAVRFLTAAVDLGGSAVELAPLVAEAHALSGDLDAALRTADLAVGSGDARVRDAGTVVAAMVLAQRGELARGAEVLSTATDSRAVDLAAIAHVATGEWRRAAELLDGTPASPTLAAGLTRRMARGLLTSVDSAPTTALSTLVSAASVADSLGAPHLLPDSPTALAAHVCLHLAELPLATTLLGGAAVDGVFGVRHQVLLAYTSVLGGDLATAARRLAPVKALRGLEPRDALLASAVDLGLARRRSDPRALEDGWETAYHALLVQPVDLFTLLPLGELVAAAARLGRAHQVAGHLDLAWDLLERSGHPPAWSVMLRWWAVHADLITGDTRAARHHVEALARHRAQTPSGRVLADAAECWLAVSTGAVDPDAVDRTATALHGHGLHWDAARLAGQAAIRTTDRATISRLLELARRLGPVSPEHESETGVLSDREQEVAALVLEGLTYREIGDRLFISGKTVEHHVTRMRQKLGCQSRRELLLTLGELLG